MRLWWSEKLMQMDDEEEGGANIDPHKLTLALLMERSSPRGLAFEMFALRNI